MSAIRTELPPLAMVMLAAGLLLAAAACGDVNGSGQSTPATSETPSTITPVVAPPTPDATAVEPEPTVDRPPDAALAAEGGDPVIGQLGTYTWEGGGSDSPWLPGAPVEVGAGEPLTVRIAGDVPIGSWAARLARADDVSGTDARPIGEGGAVVAFAAPGPGAWTVAITVRFRDGGSATYAWRLAVT